jgi:hypothetical protein
MTDGRAETCAESRTSDEYVAHLMSDVWRLMAASSYNAAGSKVPEDNQE